MTKFGVTVNVDAFRVSEMGKYQQINTIISSHLKTTGSFLLRVGNQSAIKYSKYDFFMMVLDLEQR